MLKEDSAKLASRAREMLLKHKGRHTYARGLIEFSNICHRNCRYCGLRAQNHKLRRYCLSQEEILSQAAMAKSCGADTIVLQSGEGAAGAEWLAEVVRELVTVIKLPVTLSVGERPERDYALWRNAGASRYLLRHETADEALYSRLHPGYNLQKRLSCLKVLGSLGYEVGGGFMTGLPEQKIESHADDIMLCQSLGLAMAGVGPFLPQADTPLANLPHGQTEMTLRLISILRICLPEINLPATTALASLDPDCGQMHGLLAGANVLMPNFTAPGQRDEYKIYDNKSKVSVDEAIRAMEGAGRSHNLTQFANAGS